VHVLNNLQVIDFSVPRQTGESAALAQRMEFYKIPGVSIALINDFAVEWEKGVGRLKADEAAPVDERSVFQTGSVSKFVTALVALHFVEKGLLDLDTDVNRYLSSWKIPDNEFTTKRRVTLRCLLSHQSGIPAQSQLNDSASVLQILSGEKPAENPPAVPETEPGSRWNYSNIGYVVIQMILEDLTGEPFPQLAEEVVFKPLGMTSSSFSYPLPKNLRNREAMPHRTDGSPASPEQSGQARTPGGLLSTPHDMALVVMEVMNAYLGKSDRIVSPKTARLMLAKQIDVPPEALGLPLGNGLGVFIDSTTEEMCFLHPGHNSPGTTFVFIAYPALGKGAVIAANGNLGDRLYLEILAGLAIEYRWPSGQPFKR
jgi:CubicO group peptidase (beta-lactamase class C family)